MKPIRTIAKAIILQDEHLLATHHISPTEEYYALPGGGQEIGETLQEALQRECLEEIGVRVEIGELQYVREYIQQRHDAIKSGVVGEGGTHKIEFLFTCTLPPDAQPSAGKQPDAHQVGIVWLPLKDVEQYQLYPLALRSVLKGHLAKVNGVYLGEMAAKQ